MGTELSSLIRSDLKQGDVSPMSLGDATSKARAERTSRRAKTMGAELCAQVNVGVIAPGGGTGMNAAVYDAMSRMEGFTVQIVGQSRAPYDRYPASWGGDGAPPPNLETFALELLQRNAVQNMNCLVFGSRGGQVVLPTFWQVLGGDVPPAVVINGSCAMGLPTPVHWPDSAVTFLLIGGNDYFRGQVPVNQYLEHTQRYVPRGNSTTAICLVNEMTHMPQAHLLIAVLPWMLRAISSWKAYGEPPSDEFRHILDQLRKGGWTGALSFKTAPGDAWEMEKFP
jgi:hypothetical protein